MIEIFIYITSSIIYYLLCYHLMLIAVSVVRHQTQWINYTLCNEIYICIRVCMYVNARLLAHIHHWQVRSCLKRCDNAIRLTHLVDDLGDQEL